MLSGIRKIEFETSKKGVFLLIKGNLIEVHDSNSFEDIAFYLFVGVYVDYCSTFFLLMIIIETCRAL